MEAVLPLVLGASGLPEQLQPGNSLKNIFRTGSGTESGQSVVINNAEICKITALGDAPVFMGETYSFSLLSNIITGDSVILPTVKQGATSGLIKVLSIEPSSAEATVILLNMGGQRDSNDTNGTVIITLVIIN